MLDSMTYTNHIGEVIEFGKGNILIDANTMRDYQWDYETYYGKLSNFKKKPSAKVLDVLIYGNEAKSISNRIYEIIDKDVINEKEGTLSINGFYQKGFFYSKANMRYTVDGIIKLSLYFATSEEKWTKETTTAYRPQTEQSQNGIDYPYDYPYDYVSSKKSIGSFVNESFVPQDVRITMYGAALNPTVTLEGHNYKVNCNLLSNEKLVVDTMKKTITKISENGVETNYFTYRDLESYIFEKIPTGIINIETSPQTLAADITVLETRGEPKW